MQTSQDLYKLKEELETLEARSRELSKQIGQAKKAGAPNADALIREKKALDKDSIAPLKALLSEQHSTTHSKPAGKKQNTLSISAPAPYPKATQNPTALKDLTFKMIELTIDADASEWNRYTSSHPGGTIYYQSSFLGSVSKSMGHRILLLSLQDEAGRIHAALPLVEQKSILFGHLWTSIALTNCGGVLAESKEIEQALIDHAQKEAELAGIDRLELRGLYQRPCPWTENTEKASMWLALPQEGSDKLLGSFKAKLRSQIKKGYNERVSSKNGGLELLDDFYKVFARNMRDLGTPVYGKAFFASLLEGLKQDAKLVIVYFDGRPASAAFLIRSQDHMEIPWASTIRDYNPMNLNMVLYWEVLKYSCDQGCKIFDFGRSTIDAPTYKFKKQWGAQPIQHYWYSYSPSSNKAESEETESDDNKVSTNNPKFELLIKIWKKLPLWVANLMGPSIVKYIP